MPEANAGAMAQAEQRKKVGSSVQERKRLLLFSSLPLLVPWTTPTREGVLPVGE